jgi:tetratricopeptide (TPR) repeat protein
MVPATEEAKPPVTELLSEPDTIDFGDLPAEINALLQQGVAAYRRDNVRADQLFRQALAAAPTQLPIYFCLYKIHTYQGNLDDAQAAAQGGLEEAARQAGWSSEWRDWGPLEGMSEGPGRFALYTLKALAFIQLRKDNRPQALEMLAALKELDPSGSVGWPVVAAIAEGIG